jgi:hypothetical protein
MKKLSLHPLPYLFRDFPWMGGMMAPPRIIKKEALDNPRLLSFSKIELSQREIHLYFFTIFLVAIN